MRTLDLHHTATANRGATGAISTTLDAFSGAKSGTRASSSHIEIRTKVDVGVAIQILWSRDILDHNVARRFPGGLDPSRASESVKQNSLLRFHRSACFAPTYRIVPSGNEFRPLQFPLQSAKLQRISDRMWLKIWWTWPGSNRRPPACKAGALPAELHAHSRSHLHSKAFPRILKSVPSLFGDRSAAVTGSEQKPGKREQHPFPGVRSGVRR